MARLVTAALILVAGGCEPSFDLPAPDEAKPRAASAWESYGGPGAAKFAAFGEIDASNVGELEPAWVYRTSDVAEIFQSTPVLVDGRLTLCTPYNRVIALDPLTGGELWRFDAEIDRNMDAANNFNCRGLAVWRATDAQACATRVFMATNDARLIALDAATGARCVDFGQNGEIELDRDVGPIHFSGEYQVTSPPAVVGDVVVVGSAVSDGNRLEAPSGVVRGYAAATGAQVWAFDLAPPGFDYANAPVSSAGYALGTPNVWAGMSVDPERDLLFLPTGNPSPDYYRPADFDLSHYGSSVIALRGSTGEVVWHFQTVIKDFWDYDVPSPPALADVRIGGELVPIVIQATKMGFVFVLHRETGEPVLDVDFVSVPRSGPLQDQLSPVQPFPPEAFRVSRSYEAGSSLLGLCDDDDAESVIGPIYTPIGEEWVVGLPSNMGATNWGGVAVDAARGLVFVRTSSVPFRTRLIAREGSEAVVEMLRDSVDNLEVAPQRGTDYLMARHIYLDPVLGAPCAGLPMGEVMVLDLNSQTQKWRRPHGSLRDFAMLPVEVGVPGLGGPLLTQSGLAFVGGIAEKAIRAYAVETGEELWHHRLPHPGNATPMSYVVETERGPRQFVVIAAGGDARTGVGGVGDYLVAFALPD